jgi:hypothetical protein
MSLNIQIYQLSNGDLYFNTSSEDPNYKIKCAAGGASGGHYYFINPNLINFTDYSMFSVDDYSLIKTEPINLESLPYFKVLVALGPQAPSQPTSFILRIFKGDKIFTESFGLKSGNSGVYFDIVNSATLFFILADDLQFKSDIKTGTDAAFKYLFYILLVLFISMNVYYKFNKK